MSFTALLELGSHLRLAITLAVEVAFIAFVIVRFAKTRRRRAVSVAALVLVVAGQLAAFDVFVATPRWAQSYEHYDGTAALGDDFVFARYEATTPWLGFARTRVIVLARGCRNVPISVLADEGGIEVGRPPRPTRRLGGRGRTFAVLGPTLQVVEVEAPVFDKLFWVTGGGLGALTRLRSDERARNDPALRRFFALGEP